MRPRGTSHPYTARPLPSPTDRDVLEPLFARRRDVLEPLFARRRGVLEPLFAHLRGVLEPLSARRFAHGLALV